MHGSLRGTVEDFVKHFDFCVEELKTKFEDNRKHWGREIEQSEQLHEKKLKEICDIYERLSLEIS